MFNDCITESDQNRLFELSQGLDLICWAIGDIVNENYQNVKDKYSFSYVCAAAGYYCRKSRSTIERYARAAAFYDASWREKFNGLLSMEHYLSAMAYPDWQDRLEKAAYGGMNDEPMTVDQMNARPQGDPPPPDTYPQPEETITYPQETVAVTFKTNPSASVQTVVSLIRTLAGELHLDQSRLLRLETAIGLLMDALGVKETV